MPGDLGPLLDHMPAWLMVLFRLTGIFVLAPVLGSNLVFRQIKVFLAVGLSLCIYPMLLAPGRASAAHIGAMLGAEVSLWALAPAIALELLVGLVIGYGASLPLIGMQIGGHMIDQQVGLGMAGVFNPEIGDQAGLVGQLFFMLALTLFTILGGHRVMLVTLVGSFERVPLGGFSDFASLVHLAIGLLSSAFELAIRVAAPLLCLIFLETVAMGFIARTVPQINILSIGFALRVLIGMLLLVAAIGTVVSIYIDSLHETMRRLMGAMAM